MQGFCLKLNSTSRARVPAPLPFANGPLLQVILVDQSWLTRGETGVSSSSSLKRNWDVGKTAPVSGLDMRLRPSQGTQSEIGRYRGPAAWGVLTIEGLLPAHEAPTGSRIKSACTRPSASPGRVGGTPDPTGFQPPLEGTHCEIGGWS